MQMKPPAIVYLLTTFTSNIATGTSWKIPQLGQTHPFSPKLQEKFMARVAL